MCEPLYIEELREELGVIDYTVHWSVVLVLRGTMYLFSVYGCVAALPT